MSKLFVLVAGDIGSAKMMLPVIPLLKAAGVDAEMMADVEGEGYKILNQAGVRTYNIAAADVGGTKGVPLEEANLLFIGTCGTANKLERTVAAKYLGKKPVVLGADGFFNHNRLDWRGVEGDYWLAITQEHAADIRRRRPQLRPEQVLVVGNPAFDNLPALYQRKDEVRWQRRRELNLTDNQILAIWWSQGTECVMQEDVAYAQEAICCLTYFARPMLFAPMIHPKLERIRAGYIDQIRQKIEKTATDYNVALLPQDAVRGQMPPEEFCLAADVIFDITSTEGIKSNILGGPPVIHFIGIETRQWFEKDLGLEPRDYLPDVRSYQSFAAKNFMELARYIQLALHPVHNLPRQEHLERCGWQPPTIDNAAERIANVLLEIVG